MEEPVALAACVTASYMVSRHNCATTVAGGWRVVERGCRKDLEEVRKNAIASDANAMVAKLAREASISGRIRFVR